MKLVMNKPHSFSRALKHRSEPYVLKSILGHPGITRTNVMVNYGYGVSSIGKGNNQRHLPVLSPLWRKDLSSSSQKGISSSSDVENQSVVIPVIITKTGIKSTDVLVYYKQLRKILLFMYLRREPSGISLKIFNKKIKVFV